MLAALLLFSVGILIPAAASPVRICFIELALVCHQDDSKCCSDCGQDSDQPDPCCLEIEELPDSSTPGQPIELPAAVIAAVLESPHSCPERKASGRDSFARSTPIRGPTSPAAYRAVLGIWRL
jgi:hypothetical protein